MDYSIWNSILNNADYTKVKTIGAFRRKIEKPIKKTNVNYIRNVINVSLSRVRSVDENDDELIILEHS